MTKNSTKILLVSSDAKLLDALEKTLAEEGRSSRSIMTREEARRALESDDYDASLVDLAGLTPPSRDLLSVIIQSRPGMLPLLLTDSPNVEQALAALEAGVARLLVRPMKLLEIARALREVLRDTEPRKRRRHSRAIVEKHGAALSLNQGFDLARVLVVDDNVIGNLELAATLRTIECDAVVATCGQEALHRLSDATFDALVMPDDMGDMFAHDALLRARKIDAEVAAIITLTAPSFDQLRTFVHQGADAVIVDPLANIEGALGVILHHGKASKIRRRAPSLDDLLELARELRAAASASGPREGRKKKSARRYFAMDTIELPDLTAPETASLIHDAPTTKPPRAATTPKPAFVPLFDFSVFFNETGTRPELETPGEELIAELADALDALIDTDHGLELHDEDETEPSIELSRDLVDIDPSLAPAKSGDLDLTLAESDLELARELESPTEISPRGHHLEEDELVVVIDDSPDEPSLEIDLEAPEITPVSLHKGAAKSDEPSTDRDAVASAPFDAALSQAPAFPDVFHDVDTDTPTIEVDLDVITRRDARPEPPAQSSHRRKRRSRDTVKDLRRGPRDRDTVKDLAQTPRSSEHDAAPRDASHSSAHLWDQIIEKTRSSPPPPERVGARRGEAEISGFHKRKHHLWEIADEEGDDEDEP